MPTVVCSLLPMLLSMPKTTPIIFGSCNFFWPWFKAMDFNPSSTKLSYSRIPLRSSKRSHQSCRRRFSRLFAWSLSQASRSKFPQPIQTSKTTNFTLAYFSFLFVTDTAGHLLRFTCLPFFLHLVLDVGLTARLPQSLSALWAFHLPFSLRFGAIKPPVPFILLLRD